MDNDNRYRRRDDDEDFESFVERQFRALNERLDDMGVDIAGLEVDEQTLATVIPAIATGMADLHATLTSDEATIKADIATHEADVTALTAAEAQVAADAPALEAARAETAKAKEELAKAEGELGRVAAVKEALDPIVAQAQTLVPAAPAGP